MELSSIIKLKYGSLRRFSEQNSIPYSTLHDLCSGQKDLMDCNGRTLFKIAHGLDITVDSLLQGESFQIFRDNLHHEYVHHGGPEFLVRHLKANDVVRLWHNEQKLKALYLLAMIDTICEREELPFAQEYDQFRSYSLADMFYVGNSGLDKDAARENSLPQFLKYNICEGSIDDAV